MIRADLRTYLLAQTSITACIGQRLYLTRLPYDATFPAVSYQRMTGGYGHDLDGATGYCEAIFDFDVWGNDTVANESAGEALRLKLQGFTGTMGSTSVKRVTLDNETDYFHPPQTGDDPGIHRINFRYTIGFYVAVPSY